MKDKCLLKNEVNCYLHHDGMSRNNNIGVMQGWLFIFGNNAIKIEWLKQPNARIEMKNMGKPKYYLGVQFFMTKRGTFMSYHYYKSGVHKQLIVSTYMHSWFMPLQLI